jgi:2,4-dienoyl-CoA reductase-like NADH-dependent reductase (Old Yellow Enzyme family)
MMDCGFLSRKSALGHLLLLLAGFLLLVKLQAHDVVWWEDPDGFSPSNAMDFYYPWEVYDYIGVVPSTNEPCTVVVNLNPPSSTLISAQVLPTNPANEKFTLATGNQILAAREADVVAFGVPFLVNPDLPERFRRNAPLNEPDPSTFYAPGPKGYTDYRALG